MVPIKKNEKSEQGSNAFKYLQQQMLESQVSKSAEDLSESALDRELKLISLAGLNVQSSNESCSSVKPSPELVIPQTTSPDQLPISESRDSTRPETIQDEQVNQSLLSSTSLSECCSRPSSVFSSILNSLQEEEHTSEHLFDTFHPYCLIDIDIFQKNRFANSFSDIEVKKDHLISLFHPNGMTRFDYDMVFSPEQSLRPLFDENFDMNLPSLSESGIKLFDISQSAVDRKTESFSKFELRNAAADLEKFLHQFEFRNDYSITILNKKIQVNNSQEVQEQGPGSMVGRHRRCVRLVNFAVIRPILAKFGI